MPIKDSKARLSQSSYPVGGGFCYIYLIFVITTLIWCRNAFQPETLWLDDLWVAVLVKNLTVTEMFKLAPPVPLGFLVVQKFFYVAFKSPELSLQIFPFVCFSLAAFFIDQSLKKLKIPALFRILFLLLVMTNRDLVTYAIRAKQYTLDLLCTSLLFYFSVNLQHKISSKYVFVFLICSICCLLLSVPSVFIVLAVFAALLLKTKRQIFRMSAFSLTAYMLLLLAYYYLNLRHQARPAMVGYWSEFFFPATKNWKFLTRVFNPNLRWLIYFLPIGVFFVLS